MTERPTAHRVPPAKTGQARELRKAATTPERVLWNLLRNRQLDGLRFRRQHVVGPYVADFYCAEHKLVVELDGMSHDERIEYDERRNEYMRARGLRVVRITNSDLMRDPPEAAEYILRRARSNSND